MQSEQPDRGRERWLRQPDDAHRGDRHDSDRAQQAIDRLTAIPAAPAGSRDRQARLAEAYASSLIESVDQPVTNPRSWSHALYRALDAALQTRDPGELTGWHRILMERGPDPRVTPRQYRRGKVWIGSWTPPHWSELDVRMREFIEWMREEKDTFMRVAWGHRYFETVHPFDDGNGRIGRLLICQATGSPLMISPEIAARRGEYYELLAHGTWEQWSGWMADRVCEAADATISHLQGSTEYADDETAARTLAKAPEQRWNR